MIIERREFLEMLTEIESSRSTLNEEFKAALVGIRRFSKHLQDAERIELDDVRRFAADIDRTLGHLLVTNAVDGSGAEMSPPVPAAEVAGGARGTS